MASLIDAKKKAIGCIFKRTAKGMFVTTVTSDQLILKRLKYDCHLIRKKFQLSQPFLLGFFCHIKVPTALLTRAFKLQICTSKRFTGVHEHSVSFHDLRTCMAVS